MGQDLSLPCRGHGPLVGHAVLQANKFRRTPRMKCQKCRQAIKLHGSLEDMSPAAFGLLVGSSSTPSFPDPSVPAKPAFPQDRREIYERSLQSPGGKAYRQSAGRAPSLVTQSKHATTTKSTYQSPAESFVVLTESQVIPPPGPQSPNRQSNGTSNGIDPAKAGGDQPSDKLSKGLRRSENIFEILSARTDVDHPVCKECAEMLVEGYAKKLASVTKERDAFVEYLKKINVEIPTEAEKEAAQKELEELEAEEAKAMKELQDAEKERSEVEQEIKRLEAKSALLDQEEEQFWRERNTFQLKLEEFQNERDGVNLQYDHDSRQLERLQRTNVYNDTFCIGHDGYFGTINGLRLGRLPNQPVEWSEINAAWGQTLLLLVTIAEKLGFDFKIKGYRLKPMGSTSRIEKLDSSSNTVEPKVTVLELFTSGDLPIGRMFMHRRFDQAMVAFLECLRHLGEWVEQKDPDLKLPYKIAKDKIGDSCIRLAFNQDEAWTRACKYTLTCVKFLLAHTSNTAYGQRPGNS